MTSKNCPNHQLCFKLDLFIFKEVQGQARGLFLFSVELFFSVLKTCFNFLCVFLLALVCFAF